MPESTGSVPQCHYLTVFTVYVAVGMLVVTTCFAGYLSHPSAFSLEGIEFSF